MSRIVNWGILGCSRIARNGLLPGIRESALGRVVALASREPARARAWAAEFAVAEAYGSYEQLLADRLVDAVYIGLPNHLHKPWTLAAARAGKHVLCDKPLALDAAEAEEMADTCRHHGVLLMEGFMWRHHPRTVRLTELVRQGVIGPLRMLRYSFTLRCDPGDWRLDPACGGGALLDVGCYGINTARLLCGAEPQVVRAGTHQGPTGVDLTVAATLSFPTGVLAQIDCSIALPFYYRVDVVGTEATLVVSRDSLSGDPPKLALHRGERIEPIEIPSGNQFAIMVDHFGRSIVDGVPLEHPGEDGLANMRVLDRIRASADSE